MPNLNRLSDYDYDNDNDNDRDAKVLLSGFVSLVGERFALVNP